MDRIEALAELSIRRGLSFAALGIGMAMLGFSFDPAMALGFGAVASLLVSAALALKALAAPRRPYRRTELWILLDGRHDLPEERAQAQIGGLLQRLYLRYAQAIATFGGVMLFVSVAVRLI